MEISAADWSNVTAYVVGDQVKYIDKSIYQCWVDNTGELPTNTEYWFKIQDKFVGIEPRIKYNAQHLLFEWSLNEWFGTTFVNTPGSSDIFIDNSGSNNEVFYIGYSAINSSLIIYGNGEATTFIQAINIANTGVEFTINVPIAVANTLTNETPDSVPNISTSRENIIRQIADLYCYAELTIT